MNDFKRKKYVFKGADLLYEILKYGGDCHEERILNGKMLEDIQKLDSAKQNELVQAIDLYAKNVEIARHKFVWPIGEAFKPGIKIEELLEILRDIYINNMIRGIIE